MPIVIEPGLDAAGVCLQLRQAIKDMGPAKAFGLGKIVVAYSGPSAAVRSAIKTSFTGNWLRSQIQAKRLGGRRLDDTEVGQFLATFDFETYFTDHYGLDRRAKEQAELQVWGCGSEEFMKAKFRELATAVCAADPERVFRKYEIAAVLKNRRVKIINNRPVQLFKDFQKIHPDEAYRLFCLTELLEARRYAQKENTKEAWDDYRERRCLFMLDRQYAPATKLSPIEFEKIKEQKRVALTAHSMSMLTKSLMAGPKRAARRPRVTSKRHKIA